MRDRGRPHRAAGAGLVFNEDRAELAALAHLVGPRPADDVEHAARRKRQHQPDRPRWIGVRPQDAGRRGKTGGTGRQMKELPTRNSHNPPLFSFAFGDTPAWPPAAPQRNYTDFSRTWRGAR